MRKLKSYDKFKNLARKLITEHNTSNPFDLCSLLGIKVIYIDKFKSFFGMYCKIKDEKCIIINSRYDELTKRIICSHELGHSFQDFGSVVFHTIGLAGVLEQVENEANYFAAELIFSSLIPDNLVNDENSKLLNDLIRYL